MKIPRTYIEARIFADDAAARAEARVKRMVQDERKEQARIARLRPRQRPQTTLDEDLAVDRRLTADTQYKYAVSDCNFYMQYACMLGYAEVIARLDKIAGNPNGS